MGSSPEISSPRILTQPQLPWTIQVSPPKCIQGVCYFNEHWLYKYTFLVCTFLGTPYVYNRDDDIQWYTFRGWRETPGGAQSLSGRQPCRPALVTRNNVFKEAKRNAALCLLRWHNSKRYSWAKKIKVQNSIRISICLQNTSTHTCTFLCSEHLRQEALGTSSSAAPGQGWQLPGCQGHT